MLLNCGVEEDTWKSLGQQGDPVNPKWNQSWIFIGRTDAEAETPIIWQPDAKNWLTGKDSDAGKDWKQEEKGMTEDEMAGWQHRLNGHEFEKTLGVGQGSLVCCSPWGCKELDMTVWPNWTEKLQWGGLCVGHVSRGNKSVPLNMLSEIPVSGDGQRAAGHIWMLCLITRLSKWTSLVTMTRIYQIKWQIWIE